MRVIPWKIAPWILLGALIAAPGCGGKPRVETSTTEATVKGIVKIRGKPAQGGTVSFNPANYQRPVGAVQSAIGKDGSYTVKTLIGENRVNVDTPEVRKDPALAYQFLSIDVREGENHVDIDLPP